MNPRDTVRAGYERAAEAYLAERRQEAPDVDAINVLLRRLPPGRRVLDAGCGAGLPIADRLCRSHRVVGVDFSTRQLALAAGNVPAAEFACMDLTRLGFAAASFDAIVSYYAIIHIPRDEHAAILADFHRLLKPGGLAFLCLGAESLANDVDENYFGVRMYWSHFDAATNLNLVGRAGFEVLWSEIIKDTLGDDATGGHLFVLARKP